MDGNPFGDIVEMLSPEVVGVCIFGGRVASVHPLRVAVGDTMQDDETVRLAAAFRRYTYTGLDSGVQSLVNSLNQAFELTVGDEVVLASTDGGQNFVLISKVVK